MLDGLARDGIVERHHSETDRRCVLIRLTAAGEQAVETAHDVIEAWRRQVFESLEPEEREPAARLLNRLSQIMEQQL
jgi:DNA-binding MarR family transcriptional regulator